MARDFKKLSQQARIIEPRAAIPQIDPEDPKPMPAATVDATETPAVPATVEPASPRDTGGSPSPQGERPTYLTPVTTGEKGSSQAFQMLPSRHAQLKDLAYIEGRKPWQIIEDALEEYVIKHYGKEYRRKS